MLPPFIIDQIREREEKQRERSKPAQPTVQLPYPIAPARESQEREDSDRGVVIIDLMGSD